MINWKTTLAGLVTAVLNIITLFSCDILNAICITAEQKLTLSGSITTIGVVLIAIFAKDKDVSGGSKPQTPEAEKRIKLV